MTATERPKVSRFRSIQTKLVAGIGLILLLALVTGIIGLISLRQVQASIEATREDAGQIQELALNLEHNFLLARQDEEDFLDNWRTLGFEAANEQYVTGGTQLHLNRARENLASLRDLLHATQSPHLQALTADADQLPALLDDYETVLLETVSQIEERSGSLGVEQSLRGQLAELENTTTELNRPDMLQTILRIRADEQAYFSSGQQEYIDNVRILVNQFKDTVDDIPPSQLMAGTTPVSRQQLIGAIDTYLDTFDQLVGLDQQIEVNTTIFKDVTIDIGPLVENITQRAATGLEQARTQLQSVTFQSTVALVGIMLLVLVSGGGITIWLTRKIIPPFAEFNLVTRQLGQGDLSQRVRIDSQDEFETLADGFNDMASQLEILVDSLEETVQDRTRRLELMAIFSERASGNLRVEDLIYEVVNQICERLGYYHAQIYLLDSEGEKLVMAEGTGPAGARMKAEGHHIPLDAETSLVARAARSGQIVKVDDVREIDSWLTNPFLPETRSEIAVPIVLAAEGQVSGVLDVHENVPSGFDESDSSMLRYISNQIEAAIRNTSLIKHGEAALADAKALQQQYLEQSWQKYLSSRPAVDRKSEHVQPGAPEVSSEMELLVGQMLGEVSRPAFVDVEPHASPDQPGRSPRAIVAPITIQQKNIGSLKIYPMHEDQQWRDQDLALVETVLNQFVQSVENLRLLGETQERASRERLIGQISDKLRRAPDFETLMKIGVDELSRVLQPSKIFVQMGTRSNQQSTGKSTDVSKVKNSEEPSLPPESSIDGSLKQTSANGRGDEQQ